MYLVAVMDWASRKVLSWRHPMLWKRHSNDMIALKYSTLTRGVSLPLRLLPPNSRTVASGSAWMAEAAGGIMFSSNAYGRALNMRKCTSKPTVRSRWQGKNSVTTLNSTTISVAIKTKQKISRRSLLEHIITKKGSMTRSNIPLKNGQVFVQTNRSTSLSIGLQNYDRIFSPLCPPRYRGR